MSKSSFIYFRSKGAITKDLTLTRELGYKALQRYTALGLMFYNLEDSCTSEFTTKEWCDALTVAEKFGFAKESDDQLIAACCFLNLRKFGMWDTIVIDKKPEVTTVFKESAVPSGELKSLQKKCEQQKRKIQKLQSYIAKIDKSPDKEEKPVSKSVVTPPIVTEEETVVEPTVEEIVLPKRGILVVGGHPNVISKLQKSYPDWVYLSGNSPSIPYLSTAVFAVFMQHSLSHSSYYAFLSRYDIPTMVTDITNIDLLLRAIYMEYKEKVSNKCL